MHDKYESPLSSRYASDEMLSLFSAKTRYSLWRKLWAALAYAQRELGLDISEEQILELENNVNNIDFDVVAQKEKEIRHDVMAHVYEYGTKCPKAAGIIHLGATSCYVTDNADLLIYKSGLELLREKLVGVVDKLCNFALEYRSMPTLGYTHFQPAQLVTVGKRACLWIQDFMLDLDEIDFTIDSIKLLGSKGTTGTQASFLSLFDGDHEKVKKLDEIIASRMGVKGVYPVSGQTYPRKLDSRILGALSGIAQSAYRFAGDIRLLQHMHEVEEPFEKEQVGSSAMAYKRNPMRSERICSLARYIMADALNAPMTAATQWFERTLDDSANRRISMPEGFLAADAVLRLCGNISRALVVYPKVIARNVEEQLPFMATENLLMAKVKLGGDRQKLHEIIRIHSMEASKRMKHGDGVCDLIARLQADGTFDDVSFDDILRPEQYVGRCPEQVLDYINFIVRPRIGGEVRDEDTDDITV